MQREVTSGHPRSCREKAHQCSHFYGSHYPNLLKSNEFYRKTGLCENRVPKNSLQKSSKSARELESASELDLESELFTRASRERERERACERAGELARSLAKNLKSSSSRSLARGNFCQYFALCVLLSVNQRKEKVTFDYCILAGGEFLL